MFRIYKGTDTKQFCEAENLKFAISLARDVIKSGHTATIKELRKTRWFTIWKGNKLDSDAVISIMKNNKIRKTSEGGRKK